MYLLNCIVLYRKVHQHILRLHAVDYNKQSNGIITARLWELYTPTAETFADRIVWGEMPVIAHKYTRCTKKLDLSKVCRADWYYCFPKLAQRILKCSDMQNTSLQLSDIWNDDKCINLANSNAGGCYLWQALRTTFPFWPQECLYTY